MFECVCLFISSFFISPFIELSSSSSSKLFWKEHNNQSCILFPLKWSVFNFTTIFRIFRGHSHTKTKNQPGVLYFPAIFESLREVMESRWVQNQFQIWMDGPGNGFKMTQNDQISPPKWRWKTAVLTLWTSVACDFTWFRVISRDFAWFGVNLGDFGWFWSSKIVHFGCLSHLKCQKWSFLKL